MQLIIDLYECRPGMLDDPEALTSLLVKAPDGLGVVVANDTATAVWETGAEGLGGLLQLTDGALEIFTRVSIGVAWVSLFRLQDFDHVDASTWFVAQLQADKADLQVVQRGPMIRTPRPGPTAPWLRTGKPTEP